MFWCGALTHTDDVDLVGTSDEFLKGIHAKLNNEWEWEFSDVGLPVCSLFSLVSSGCAHDMGWSRLALGVTTNHFAAIFDGVGRCFGVSCLSS